ncbi:MAG: primosomal protein N' [Candidatus Schekmanbacteria bacterium]|nr:MAG: primosomal protein N' [Candidatus Schekmanbacteria bacterium]
MDDSLKYIRVAVEFNTRNLYTYAISEESLGKIKRGSRVLVPFGKREITGYVEEILDNKDTNGYQIKEISFVIDEEPLISDDMIRLCHWASEYFLSPIAFFYRCAYPPGSNFASSLKIAKKEEIKVDEYFPLLSDKEKELLNIIEDKKAVTVKSLKKKYNFKNVYTLISKLREKGIIESFQKIGKPKISEKLATIICRGENFDEAENRAKLGSNQLKLIELIKKEERVEFSIASKITGITHNSLKSLEKAGFIKTDKIRIYRKPDYEISTEHETSLKLTSYQAIAFQKIIEAIDKAKSTVFLLHGITGSGKTEIYLQLIQYVLSKGKNALLLVPEISLTPQMLSRFRARFGDKVAVLHSSLSYGERYDEWYRIYNGKAQIVIGTRSAVFAPIGNLGVVVIDEEHDDSYKQEEIPNYDAREIALKRAEFESIPVVLGSASPSIESYYKAKKGEYCILSLPERATGIPLPIVKLIDMKREKNKVISKELRETIQESCRRSEQAILFLNRRGYNRIVQCYSCGAILTCRDCSVSLVLHRSDNLLHCHYCGALSKKPPLCPLCKKEKLKGIGIGTESLEAEIKEILKGKRVQRFDKDALTGKKSLSAILETFKKGEIDVLVGTQMLSLGHDYPNVTLVGVIAADQELNFPDFRAAERAFQILLQVSGRCGRSNLPGISLIQTYQPDNYVLEALKNHDYESFYEKEILFREKFKYPPFSKLINITFSGIRQVEVKKTALSFKSVLKEKISSKTVQILGPAEPLRWKIRGKYRRQILIKYTDEPQAVKKALDEILKNEFSRKKGVMISIDVDPVNLL